MSQINRKFSLNFVSEMTGGNRVATLVLLAGLGVFLFFWPNTALTLIIRIVGAVLLVLGGQYILSWYRGGMLGDREPVVIGGVLALIGLFFLLSPGTLVGMVNVVAGILLIIYGYTTLSAALASREGSSGRWIISAAIAAATLIFGIVCLFSHAATTLIVRGIAIALIINAVSQFLSTGKNNA